MFKSNVKKDTVDCGYLIAMQSGTTADFMMRGIMVVGEVATFGHIQNKVSPNMAARKEKNVENFSVR